VTSRSPALALAACIRGETPSTPRYDWDAVISLANRTWMTPQLFVSLSRSEALTVVPADVRQYLEFIYTRNLERNRSLQQQLREVIQEFNAHNIVPTVLKGGLDLVDERGNYLGARMIADLDLLICATKITAAVEALAKLDYRELKNADGESNVFARRDDAGVIEVHCWPPSSLLYRSLAGIEAAIARPVFETLWIRVPPAHLRILHLVIHDQIKEGDHWRARVDFRHLYDIARMAASEMEWDRLRAAARPGLERDALECTLMMAERIFGTKVPPCANRTRAQAVRHWCRIAQLVHPIAAAPLRLVGDITWVQRRIGRREIYEWPGWRASFRTLGKTIRTPALAYRALTGINLGPKA
jgi:Uncharacterised nucleotidyltransferase